MTENGYTLADIAAVTGTKIVSASYDNTIKIWGEN